MVKPYVKNVILVMSGGSGSRFGTDCPKQYCIMNGRLVIDYVIDACRKSKKTDEIVIVASKEYTKFVEDRYGTPAIEGGSTRPESVRNGIKFINENYNCDKLIITNAVCPLATSEQYDRYFEFLDNYDFVLTTWKVAPALHKFDGTRVDRDDYFELMEPDAYKFQILYNNYNFTNLQKYIFHNMPLDSKPMFCFDYPYTTKLTYHHDLKVISVLYNELVLEPEKENTLQVVNNYLSSSGTQGINKWISLVQRNIDEIAQKYEVTSYSINSHTEANIVYEAVSNIHGNIVIKFTPSKFHFLKEFLYYKHAKPKTMAGLIDYNEEFNVIVLKMVKPGIQIKFNVKNDKLKSFFDKINDNMIPENIVIYEKSIPTIMSEFEEYVESARRFTFEYDFRKLMENKARKIWDKYFKNAKKYFLHRDLHRRNILSSINDEILAIDPRGAIGPKAFEFVIIFIIELREYDQFNEKMFNQMFNYFISYVSEKELRAALFIFWVYKMNDYVFQKNDNYKLASWCKECILKIYFPNISEDQLVDTEPEGI